MKNITIIFFLLAVITVSCKKSEISKDTDGELHNIKFSTSSFTQETGLLATNALATNAVLDGDNGTKLRILHYLVYNDQFSLIRKISQKATDTDFGTITDKLPVGTYTVFFIGGDNFYPAGSDPDALLQITLASPYNNAFAEYSNEGMREIFGKKMTLTVTTEDVDQTVTLERVNGLIDVNILDAVPNNVNSIKIVANSYSVAFSLKNYTGTVSGGNYTKKYGVAAIKGTSDNHLVMSQLNTTTAFNVIVTAYDITDKVIAEKTIFNVQCRPNKKTILTGNLFGGSLGTGGINVGGDPTWNATPIVQTF
jgi:hypothetical protein